MLSSPNASGWEKETYESPDFGSYQRLSDELKRNESF
jgi:hypothetical protein